MTRYKGRLRHKKFKFRSNKTADIVLMRKVELILIEAELNQLPKAVEKLNELGTQTGINSLTLLTLSKSALIEEIPKERREELFEESFGLYDIKRRQKSV